VVTRFDDYKAVLVSTVSQVTESDVKLDSIEDEHIRKHAQTGTHTVAPELVHRAHSMVFQMLCIVSPEELPPTCCGAVCLCVYLQCGNTRNS